MITFFFHHQELKKAILEDLVRLGKASGLHSFEQVDYHYNINELGNHRVLFNMFSIVFHFASEG